MAEYRLTVPFPAPHQRGTPPLVGRRREQSILHEELSNALDGSGRLFLLSGEAGIGKTSLARVLTGHCYDLTNTPPYGPWLDFFAQYPPESEPGPPSAFAGGWLHGAIGDQGALFRETGEVIAALARQQPLLLILEDLHSADAASIELLRHLAARLARWPLLLLATYRAEDVTRHHPLARRLPAIVREADAARIDLPRLNGDDLDELVASQFPLSADDHGRLVAYLTAHADGIPFYVTELLRTLGESSVLRPAGEQWSLAALDHLLVPPLLSQVIEARIARLGEEARSLLAIAAVIGQEIDVDLWSMVSDVAQDRLLDIAERAVEAHLLEAEREGSRVRFVHALTREALYEGILPPRRRIWRQRIADTLMSRPRTDPDVITAHLQRAHDPRPDARDADLIPLVANRIQHRRGGHAWFAAACGLLDDAMTTGETFVAGLMPSPELGALVGSAAGHAWQGLGVAYAARGRPADGSAAYARARAFYDPLDHHAVIAFSYLGELRNVALAYHADEPERRQRLASAAEAALAHAGGALAPGLSPRLAWLSCLVLGGHWDEAEAILDQLPPPGVCYLRREITAAIATIARQRGETDHAWQAIAAVLPEGPQTIPGTTIHLEALHLQRLAADLALDSGDLALAQAWLEAHDRWLRWNETVLGQADGRLVWARYHRARQDIAVARAEAAAALALASEPRQPLALLAAHRLVGELASEAHERDLAEMHLRAALAMADACGTPFERAVTLLALGTLRLQQRRLDDAAACLDAATEIGRALRAQPLLSSIEAQDRRTGTSPAPLPFGLTAREREVLRLTAQGLTNQGIAERLFISPRTVGQHLRDIYAKLDVFTRAAATRTALEHGLV